MRKKRRLLFLSGLLVIICLVLFLLAPRLLRNKMQIDIQDYLQVSFSGYNTCGKCSVSVDFKELAMFMSLYNEKIDLEKTEKTLESFIEINVSSESDISNGDFILITEKANQWVYSCSPALWQFNFVLSEKELKVSGLTELTDYDPFGDLVVNYSGENGEGSISAVIEHKDEVFEWAWNLTCSEENGALHNGMDVVLSLDVDNKQMANSFGVNIIRNSLNYTLVGFGEYPIQEAVSLYSMDKLKNTALICSKQVFASYSVKNISIAETLYSSTGNSNVIVFVLELSNDDVTWYSYLACKNVGVINNEFVSDLYDLGNWTYEAVVGGVKTGVISGSGFIEDETLYVGHRTKEETVETAVKKFSFKNYFSF